jgi:hypothetical protein
MGSSERGLPFLSDLIYIQIARHLQCRELGRLARASSRFGLVRPIQVHVSTPNQKIRFRDLFVFVPSLCMLHFSLLFCVSPMLSGVIVYASGCIHELFHMIVRTIQGEQQRTTAGQVVPLGDIEHWTIVEEGARQRVHSSAMRSCVPRRGTESWMRLLRELERLQRPIFTAKGPEVVLRNNGRTAVRLSGGTTAAQQFYLQSAVCAAVDLRAGSHFIEFVWVAGRAPQRKAASVSSEHVAETLGLLEDEDEEDDPFLAGVCSPNFDPTDGSMASNDATATLFSARTGRLRQYRDEHVEFGFCEQDWPGRQSAAIGDVIGLLLDFEEGSLAVYCNGERCGMMVRSGLTAPLRWCVDLDPEDRTEVNVRGTSAVPPVTSQVKSEEHAAWRSFRSHQLQQQ